MTKKSSTPAIRFKGFTDTWEQRKVTELGKIYIGLVTTMTAHYTDEGTLLIRNSDIKDGRFEFGENPIFLEKSFAMANESRMHQIGDVITVHTGDVGTSAVISENEDKSIGFATIVTRPNKTIIDPSYLCTFLNTERHKKWAVAISTGDGRTNYNLGDYFELVVPVPSIKEQKQIAMFIENLNNLITLHQRKYDKLTNVKKSMLEKMFPKNGSNVPEIRFKGFTEAWEQRELWELTIWDKKFNEVEAEKQPKIIKYPYVLADVFSKIEDASGDVRLLSTGNYIGYTTDEKAGKNLCVGEVVAIPWGGVPNIKYYKGKFVTADNRIATSNDTETLGNRFLSLYLEHSLAFLQSIYRGASIKHPSMNDVLSMQISIPHIQEQREIETWFANLDNLITLHQRELEKLKNLKKACLEKMFV